MSYIYLASPYTSPDREVMESRYKQIMLVVREFLLNGQVVYSPILHCHPIAVEYGLPRDFNFWQAFDHAMIRAASFVMIIQLEGWEDSIGIKNEVDFARSISKPVVMYNPITKETSYAPVDF